MLVLSRKLGETIHILIDNSEVLVRVTDIRADKVQLGIEAPANIKIYRHEVLQAIKKSEEEAKK